MPLPFQPKPLDADAAAYIARSGATDRAAINAFVRGVKALGLWNNMVCWPLRSSQNAGTGDTVYSLGGLGTFNGTRVNGPAWTADGIDFNGTDQSISTSFNPSFNNVCAYAAAVQDDKSVRRLLFSQKGSGVFSGFSVFIDSFVGGALRGEVFDGTAFRVSNTLTATVAGSWFSGGIYWDKANVSSRINGTASASLSTNSTTTRALRIGTDFESGAGFYWDGRVSAMIVVHDKGDVFEQLRSLYKSTLGTGLGLP